MIGVGLSRFSTSCFTVCRNDRAGLRPRRCPEPLIVVSIHFFCEGSSRYKLPRKNCIFLMVTCVFQRFKTKRPRTYMASCLSWDRDAVIPAYAGIQNFLERREISNWIPAFAGMTGKVLIPKVSRLKWEAFLCSNRLEAVSLESVPVVPLWMSFRDSSVSGKIEPNLVHKVHTLL